MKRYIVEYKKYYKKFLKKLEKHEVEKVKRAVDVLRQKQEFELTHFALPVVGVKGVYELRTQYGNNELRIYYIYEGENIVILFNGIKKKDQKITKKDIEKIKIIKKQYDKER